MPLSWNEIKSRAIAFSQEWQNETSERAESQSFWNDFFNVFGISRRRVATFEKRVKKSGNRDGFYENLNNPLLKPEKKKRPTRKKK